MRNAGVTASEMHCSTAMFLKNFHILRDVLKELFTRKLE